MKLKLFGGGAGNDPFQGLNLGDSVTDTITGFSGCVTARVEYLTGCHQMLVQPRQKQGEITCPDAHWFDVERLEKTAEAQVEKSARRVGPDQLPSKRDTLGG